jgi:hypothetical protein
MIHVFGYKKSLASVKEARLFQFFLFIPNYSAATAIIMPVASKKSPAAKI